MIFAKEIGSGFCPFRILASKRFYWITAWIVSSCLILDLLELVGIIRETLEKPGRLSENRGINQGQDFGDGR
jgi:hypothetical protein